MNALSWILCAAAAVVLAQSFFNNKKGPRERA